MKYQIDIHYQNIFEVKDEKEAVKKYQSLLNLKALKDFITDADLKELVERPSFEEIRNHYILGASDNCLVCGESFTSGKGYGMTETPGEGRCLVCGTPYQIDGAIRAEIMTEYQLVPDQISRFYCKVYKYLPVIKAYWEEVGRAGEKRIPFGSTSWITQEELDSFNSWLIKNKEKYERAYPYPDFPWDRLDVQYG